MELPQGRVEGDTLVSRGGLSYSAFRSLFRYMGMILGFSPAFEQKTVPVLFSIYGRVFAQVGFCRSLPYASPPVGDLRWAHPQPPPVPGWEGTRNGRCCYFSNFSGSGQIIRF